MKQFSLLIVVLFSLTACTALNPNVRVSGTPQAKKSHGHGPPPHAPAHGYRANHQGHDLTFDTGLGVYVVVDVPDTYFHNGLYLRLGPDGLWQASVELGSGWRPADDRDVPKKLKEKKKPPKKAKKKGKKKK